MAASGIFIFSILKIPLKVFIQVSRLSMAIKRVHKENLSLVFTWAPSLYSPPECMLITGFQSPNQDFKTPTSIVLQVQFLILDWIQQSKTVWLVSVKFYGSANGR